MIHAMNQGGLTPCVVYKKEKTRGWVGAGGGGGQTLNLCK